VALGARSGIDLTGKGDTMEVAGNRIDHIIWIVRPENLERYVDEAARLFGVEFERLSDPAIPGASKDIYISFDGGLEFIAPLNSDDFMARKYLEFLDERGEGLYGFVFGVGELGSAVAHSRQLGYPATDCLQSPDPAVRHAYLAKYTTRCTDAQEAYVGELVGTHVLFGELEYARSPQRVD